MLVCWTKDGTFCSLLATWFSVQHYLQWVKVLPNFWVALNSFRGRNSLQTLFKLQKMTNKDFGLRKPLFRCSFCQKQNSNFLGSFAQKRHFSIDFKLVHHILIGHKTSSEIFLPIGLYLHGFPNKKPLKMKKKIKKAKKAFFSGWKINFFGFTGEMEVRNLK